VHVISTSATTTSYSTPLAALDVDLHQLPCERVVGDVLGVVSMRQHPHFIPRRDVGTSSDATTHGENPVGELTREALLQTQAALLACDHFESVISDLCVDVSCFSQLRHFRGDRTTAGDDRPAAVRENRTSDARTSTPIELG
jgi:hypothetical protein